MAKEKKSAKAKGESAAKKKVPVLVEMRVQRGTPASFAASMAADITAPSFEIDPEFRAIPMKPSPEHAESLAASNEETVIVRGLVTEDKISELEAHPNVIKVWRDTPIAPFPARTATLEIPVHLMPSPAMGPCPIPPCDCTFGDPANGNMAGVATYLGVDQIWATGNRGAGIVIGIVDGGITAIGRTPQPGEVARVPNVVDGFPAADWGTTAIAWGNHGNMTSTDALGMAPDAHIYDIRISSGTITGLISNAIAGYQWAIDRHRADGTPHILSNSWGIFQQSWDPVYATDPNHPFTRKMVEALDEGILILFAAGNCGEVCPDGRCGPDNGPAHSIWGANSHPRVMTVGAVNLSEQWVGYSSEGPGALDPNKPDFCSITHFAGYFPTLDPAHPSDGGTSAATPICAGVVALMKKIRSSLTQDGAKNALKSTAKDIGPVGWDQYSGSGIIRAKAAYDRISIIKLKFSDDGGIKKFRDDIVTLKFRDDQVTLKFSDDGGGIKKVVDDPVTLKFSDDGGGIKKIEDVKLPGKDAIPEPRGPVILPPEKRGATPMILATPHHSYAWAGATGGQASAGDYEAMIGQSQSALEQMEKLMEQAVSEVQALDAQYRQMLVEHEALLEQYQQMQPGGQ